MSIDEIRITNPSPSTVTFGVPGVTSDELKILKEHFIDLTILDITEDGWFTMRGTPRPKFDLDKLCERALARLEDDIEFMAYQHSRLIEFAFTDARIRLCR